ALIPNNTVVTNWFQKKRSLAMGIIATGIGLGGFVMTIVARYIIAAVGWRVSFVVWGLLVWIVIIPTVAFLIKARPEDMGLLPDGEAIERVDEGAHASSHSKEENASSQSNTHKTWTINSALGTLNFWLIAFAFFFSGAGFMAILIHLVPHVTDIGISETQAATALGLLTLISVPGRLFGGYIGDKIDKRYAIIIALGGQALTVLLFLVIFNIGNLGILYVFVVLFGFTLGMNSPLIPATIAEIYGAVSFGLIYGAVMLLGTFGTALGPVLCGYMFDTMNSYFFAFVCMTGMIFLGALCVVFLRLPEQQDA
ncbi:MAG: MFS transporter, partial [Thermodesulfobacteriota bacterium]|nr:MFS transporter [Thermodesulfobacteriota bacterium]